MEEIEAIDKLYDFCNVMQSLNSEVMLELPNYSVYFKFVHKDNERLKKVIDFYKNPTEELPVDIWQPYEEFGSNKKLEKYYFTIFEPIFPSITAQIVSDQNGEIWIHETFSGPKYDNRFIAKDIYLFFQEINLTFKSYSTVSKSLNKELMAKIWLDEKFNDPKQIMSKLIQAIDEANLGFRHSYDIKDISSTSVSIYEIQFNINQIHMNLTFNNEEYTWEIIKDINSILKQNNFGYKFAFLHEYSWDSMHILSFLSSEEYELLLKKNLINVSVLN